LCQEKSGNPASEPSFSLNAGNKTISLLERVTYLNEWQLKNGEMIIKMVGQMIRG
jgi:hypothetical protein